MLPKIAFYAVMTVGLGWLWLLYKCLVWRKRLLAYLWVRHPDLYRSIVADLSSKSPLDRGFADGDVVRRQYAQERRLLSRSIRVDTEDAHIHRQDRTFVAAIIISALIFVICTLVLVWVGGKVPV